MKEYIRIFKDWRKMARPNKWLWFFAFFFVALARTTVLIAPIFAAKVTLSITNGDYKSTILFLILVFGILFLRKLLWHFNYLVYAKLIKSSYNRINNEFVEKSLKAKSANFKSVSKEQLLNIVHSDVFTVADFADKLATAGARGLMTIISIIVIFTVNVYAGVIVFVADILDFFLLHWMNTKRQKYVKLIRESHDNQYEKFSEIIDKRETIKDLGLKKKVKREYNDILDTYIKRLHKRTVWDSWKSSGYEVFFRFLILIATIICVFLVSSNNLTLEVYFVIISYVTDGITDTKDLYGIITDFKNTSVSMVRVKTVLDFVERDEVAIGKNNLKDIFGSICFNNVSYKKDDEGNPTLKNFDVLFKENETCLLLGSRSCGKRTVFNLLRRAIVPEKGKILMDGVDLYDFSNESYRDNFSYVTTHPVFFKGSIIKNLTINEKNKNVVYQICKELGIYRYIVSLPKKFNSDISSLPFDKLYMLGLARAILTGSEVLVIYEFPETLTESEKDNVKAILRRMHGTRTILIFSAKDYCQDVSDKIISIEKGEIKSINFNEIPKDIII